MAPKCGWCADPNWTGPRCDTRNWYVILLFSVEKQHIFPACFQISIIFSNLNSDCSDLLVMRNLQEKVKKAFCYQKLFWALPVWKECSSDLKSFANSSQSLIQYFFFHNFGNKIPISFFTEYWFQFWNSCILSIW